MFKGLKPQLSYANVMATGAMFVALGGVSYAAVKVPAKSVGTKQLKVKSVGSKQLRPGSVTSSKVKDSSLLGRDFRPGQLPRGPQGAPGAAGASNVHVRLGNPASSAPFAISDAACAPGERATGGGNTGSGTGDYVARSAPTAAGPAGPIAGAGATPTGWRTQTVDIGGGTAAVQAYVVCASP